MSELKPCPFCGRTATMRDDMGHSTAVYFGCSSDLGCLGSDQWAETEEEAVAMWNTRAAIEPAAPSVSGAAKVLLESKTVSVLIAAGKKIDAEELLTALATKKNSDE